MPIEIRFAKMHGAGNDFIVVDARSGTFLLSEIRKRTAELCKRRTGIGADGILVLDKSADSDYVMHYLNADGSEAGMCGNGARCLARFAVDLGLPHELTFHVRQHLYRATVHDQYVTIFFPVKPVPAEIMIDGRTWYEINTGTEHVVSIEPEYVNTSDTVFREMGRTIRNRIDLFPGGTNVNFATILDQNRLHLVTYERGVEDLTLACGTGAIATAIARNILDSSADTSSKPEHREINEHHMQIECPGGPLEVSFEVRRHRSESTYQNIALHGPAAAVYHGKFTL